VPNGDPNFDPTEQDRWFQPIAPTIEAFAKRRNLSLEKYFHDSPAWFLRFAHPKGGDASIQITNFSDLVGVISSWAFDDDDLATRYLHWEDAKRVAKDPHTLVNALNASFRYIVTREFGDWNQVSSDLANKRRRERLGIKVTRQQYPVPRLDDIE